MKLKKLLCKLCILYMINLLSCPLLFAQPEPEACSFSNSEIEGIEVIQMSDRKIYTLFTEHLSDQYKEARNIFSLYDREVITGPLTKLLDENQERIKSEQSDVQKITELARYGQIDWLGVEIAKTNTSYVEDAARAYSNDLNDFSLSLNPLPWWGANETDQLLFLLFPNFIIARATQPETFHGIEIYPLDDEDLKKEAFDLAHEFDDGESSVKENPLITSSQYSQVSYFVKEHLASGEIISLEDFLALLNRLEIQQKVRINMWTLRRIYNEFASLMLQRDAAVVQSVLDIPGNGLLLFGTAHGPGIKYGLITACQNGK